MSRETFQFQDWYIEPELNRLRQGENVQSLEPLAMSVLAHLLERSGEVVTADSLLDEFWQGRNAEPGMVARCIAQIRQTLDDDAKNPIYIETIRKRGYRTVAPVERVIAPPAPSNNKAERQTGRWFSLGAILVVALVGMLAVW